MSRLLIDQWACEEVAVREATCTGVDATGVGVSHLSPIAFIFPSSEDRWVPIPPLGEQRVL